MKSPEPELTEREIELLSLYIDDTLTGDERKALEARLLVEPALRRELTALRRTVELVHELPTLRAPRSFALTPEMVSTPPAAEPQIQVLRRLDAKPARDGGSSRPSRLRRFNLSYFAAAAATIVLVFGVFALVNRQPVPSVTPVSIAGVATPTATSPVPAEEPEARIAVLEADDPTAEVDEAEADSAFTLMLEADDAVDEGDSAPDFPEALEFQPQEFEPVPPGFDALDMNENQGMGGGGDMTGPPGQQQRIRPTLVDAITPPPLPTVAAMIAPADTGRSTTMDATDDGEDADAGMTTMMMPEAAAEDSAVESAPPPAPVESLSRTGMTRLVDITAEYVVRWVYLILRALFTGISIDMIAP